MDYEHWYRNAISALANVKPGTRFELKQLFPRHEWDALSPGDRKAMGRYFSGKVKDGLIPSITKIERAKDNHSRYIKNKE